jgi:hypothetical protein
MKKILLIVLLVVIGLLLWYLMPKPPAEDEAKKAGIPVEHFAQAPDEPDLFAPTDGGIPMDAAQVRGRNTWWAWAGGNQAFWDWLANNSFGTFDMLKTLSSYPCSPEQSARAQKYEAGLASADGGGAYGEGGYSAPPGQDYGREQGHRGLYADYACGAAMYPEPGEPPYRYYQRSTRFCYDGLINEPGFRQATRPDKYGLCLDEPAEGNDPFPGATDEERARLEELYGRPSGILGLRLFPNPNFDQKAEAAWMKAEQDDRFYLDPKYYANSKLVRPYRVAMSCGFCHISHHPLHPPADPENPGWENLSGIIGAQYFWFGRVFAANVTPDNFVWHLLSAQRPGAVDTSFIPHDDLFNPRAMNAVFDLPARLGIGGKIGSETSAGGALDLPEVKKHLDEGGASATLAVPHILWDGADSVGIDAALTRVYINIGEYHQQWIRTIDPMVGLKKQSPIAVKDAQENSVYWNATQVRSGDLAQYLIEAGYRYPLAEAPDGERYLRGDRDEAAYEQVLGRGKVVFAENCARCHSSKLPEPIAALSEPGCIGPDYLDCWKRYWEWTNSGDFKGRMREIVAAPDFLADNYLSTDARIPTHQPLIDFTPAGIDANASTLERYLEEERQRGLATGALEGEICSPMATNAIAGHVWDNFASQSYKTLPSVGTVKLYNPITDAVFDWQTPGGGRGYQRVPSLIGVWSTAPYLHNNEVGEFTGDPSVAGRMAAFDDGIRKLLWPERRPNLVPRTSRETYLEVEPAALHGPPGALARWLLPVRGLFGGGFLLNDKGQVEIGPFPAGTPVGLVGNLNLARTDADFGVFGLLGTGLRIGKALIRIKLEHMTPEQATALLRKLVPDLVAKSACPDFIVDRGHYFGTDLSDEDKEALIEFVKTL